MDNSNVFYRSLEKDYPVIAKGEGVFVWDCNGKRYLDGASGCVVTNIGYGVTSVAEALYQEAKQTCFAHGTMFTSRPQEELARLITESAPPGLDYAYLVSGGTEANETAFSIAIQYHRQKGNQNKWKFIGRHLSYHGSSIATLSAAGNVQRRSLYSPLVMPFPLVPAPHCYRCYRDSTYPDCNVSCARELEKTILAEGPENIAAFILEPVIGTSAAASVPPPEYLSLVRQICDRYDVLMIADEVLCGYGRSGRYLAMDHWNVSADIVTLGKGLGGGYAPIGAVMLQEMIFNVFKNNSGMFIHGYTYQGNPVSCAAGVAVNRYLRENNLFQQVQEKGNYLKDALIEIANKSPIIGDVRGIGLLLGLELVKDSETKESYSPVVALAERARETAMDKGLLLYTGVGRTADITPRDYLIIAPPFIIKKNEMDLLIQILDRTLDKVSKEVS